MRIWKDKNFDRKSVKTRPCKSRVSEVCVTDKNSLFIQLTLVCGFVTINKLIQAHAD